MTRPPFEIDNARGLLYAEVRPGTWEGRTRHEVVEQLAPDPAGLAVCQYEGDSEVYLSRCASDWSPITDTAHESMSAAIDHAEYECGQDHDVYDAAAYPTAAD